MNETCSVHGGRSLAGCRHAYLENEPDTMDQAVERGRLHNGTAHQFRWLGSSPYCRVCGCSAEGVMHQVWNASSLGPPARGRYLQAPHGRVPNLTRPGGQS